jgi:ParB family chromosome partitioning protein
MKPSDGEATGTPASSRPDASDSAQIREIAIADLVPDPFQPRKEFHEGSIRELAASIDQHGLLQPLIIRPAQGPDNRGKFWIVAGERRYRAAQTLGLETLACRVLPYAHLTAAVTALVENVHREDLSEIDKAEALKRIKFMTEKGWDEVADLVKLSTVYVRGLAGLLKLEEPVKEMVRRGEIPARSAFALKPLPPQQQIEMAQRVVREGLSAEEIRQATHRSAPSRSTRTTKERPPLPDEPFSFLVKDEIEPGTDKSSSTDGREGGVTRALREMVAHLEQMSDWVAERDWPPSRLSPVQNDLFHRLYHAASHLQQQTAVIRQPLANDPKSDAERLAGLK